MRGLREPEPDLVAVHLPEAVDATEDAGDTDDTEAVAGARAAMEALLARRRQLAARMILPARGHGRPR